jgi:solute carrier family 13 (sodium-dependent dicarboxylate transporter), member 2/3/5
MSTSDAALPVAAPARTIAARPAASDLRTAIILAALAAGAVAFWWLPLEIAPEAHKALAVGLFMIAAWMTQVLDHGVTGILGCFLFWMLGIAKFETAFSGFADTSAWFLFGAVCVGLMAGKSGLARRLALGVMRAVG